MNAIADETLARPRIDFATALLRDPRARESFAARALRLSAISWLVAAVAGQLLFAYYVVVFYGRAVLRGRVQDWNRVLQAGHVQGDTVGNAVLAIHLVLAVLIMAGGALQFVPAIRRTWPRFHRWNGRVFLASVVVASLGGLWMLWVRHVVGDLTQHLASTLDVLLIVGFAAMAWRTARARRFDVHRRWALRLFLAASGVWFFRIGLMLWLVLNRGPAGFNPKTFTGPFISFLSFAEYLVPLAVLQLYFHAQERRATGGQLAVAGVLAVSTLATLAGVVAAFFLMWLPKL